ncbi:carbamoyltransferase HypF, partial [candidate division GN15 bacterium]|nr:carbamoyltransferase HypF [candidate division GN15 bacterium]
MNRTVFSRPGATDTSLTQKIRVTGVVQGVGFRPFVYRLARELGLTGYVCNDAAGVDIVVRGRAGQVRLFLERLSAEAPAVSHIRSIDAATVPAIDAANFAIRESGTGDTVRTMVPADLAVCDDCLAEMHDPADRRYRYPFINCTNCGPRFSITEELPYDRATTSMADFEMCPACNREYRDPENRRFHAEPISCWDCGPRYVLHDGRHVVASTDPVGDAATLLRDGRILAIKGVGGFHLAVDASNAAAVATLRERKGRPDKPLALMAGDLDTIRKHAEASDLAEASLLAPDRPIVLLNRRTPGSIDSSIAGDIGTLGFMLPYAPVHYLLLCADLPLLVMTSGNLAGEPLAADNDEALTSLGGVADWFLLHNRRIVHRNDDSVGREYLGDMRVVRRSRGAVPNAIRLTRPVGRPILACGADLKSAVGLARDGEFYFSQHLGELETAAGYDFYDAAISDLLQLTGTTPEL